jgi:hypothetical protein
MVNPMKATRDDHDCKWQDSRDDVPKVPLRSLSKFGFPRFPGWLFPCIVFAPLGLVLTILIGRNDQRYAKQRFNVNLAGEA